jgi:hypothetical protein
MKLSFPDRVKKFNNLNSFGEGDVCPICRTRATKPYPNCGCPHNESGYGTRHIMKYHHECKARHIGKVDAYELDKELMEAK